MKALLFVILLAYFTNTASATNYYFSAVSGNDSRSTSDAQNPSTPWKTLSKLNSYFSSLRPGDGVYLKRGETFFGSIIVKQSGTASAPITIGAFGSGNRPIITGLVTLTGWVSKGGGIWEAGNSSLGNTVNVVLYNGAQQEMGRYPNSNATNKGYLNFESHSGKTSITDKDLNTSINWTGAELVTRPRHWILNRSKITSQSGKKISYTTSSPYEPYEDYGYFIQNSLKALDKVGEWYYNSSAKKLSVYSGSSSPSNVQVSTSVEDLVSSSNYNNITFDNLTFKGCNEYAFFVNKGSNMRIQNCDILYSGVTGILVHGHSGMHIENCTISNSTSNGIDMEYSVTNAVIKNNKILNTALFAGLLQNGEGMGLAIYSNGDGATIDGNEIRRTGFIGVTFYGSNVSIKNNLVDSFCFVKDDGGGLYSHGGSIKHTNIKLFNNIVLNGVGAGPGTNIYNKVSVSGIYLDANVVNVEMQYNTVSNCFQGIFMQSTTNVVAKNNTLYNNARQLTVIQRAGSNSVRNSTITNNTLFSRTKEQYALYVMSSANDIGSFGTFDYNYYVRPVDDKLTIFNTRISGGKTINEAMDLAGWQKKYGKDAHSKKSPMTIANTVAATNESISFQYNASGVNKSVNLNGSFIDVTGKKYSGSMVLAPYTSMVLLKTGSSGNKAPTVNITSPVNSRSFTAPATITINATAADADGSVSKVEFYNGTTLLGTDNSSPYTFTWNKVAAGTYDLTAKVTDNGGASTISSTVSILVTSQGGLTAPVVNLTAPTVTTYNAPATINMSASASDNDGKVTKIEFYNGNTLLGTDISSPYSFTWANVPAGTYSLTAKATDNDGLQSTSSATEVKVTSAGGGNQAPTVSMTTPEDNATYATGSTIPLIAEAGDDGSITKVEFFNGTKLLKTELYTPYVNKWVNAPAGSYTITARATDNEGVTTISAPVHITVGSQNAARGSVASTVAPATVSSISDDPRKTNDKPSLNGLELSKLLDFKLFPNPAVNTIQINFDGLQNTSKKAMLTVYNVVGAIVKRYPVIISNKNIAVDVSPLKTGVYFIGIAGDDFKINKKFVKVN